jgi:hypothetical protein
MRLRKSLAPKWKTPRLGVGIVECLLLIVVLSICIAAILTTMGWGSKSYTFAKDDLDRRIFLFNWFQAFESFYPGIVDDFAAACAQTTDHLGGGWDTTSSIAPVTGEVTLKGVRFQVKEAANGDGMLKMDVKVYASESGSAELRFTKHFNVFSSETVSDDVI